MVIDLLVAHTFAVCWRVPALQRGACDQSPGGLPFLSVPHPPFMGFIPTLPIERGRSAQVLSTKRIDR
jgi:hypothetical protein